LIDATVDAPHVVAGSAAGGETEGDVGLYWCPQLHVSLVYDFTRHAPGSPLPVIGEHVHFHHSGLGYFPIVWFYNFWMLRSDYMAINETTPTMPLDLSYSTQPLWKFQILHQMEAQWQMQADWGASEEGEHDVLKSMVLDTNPWLLGITVAVSMLHMVFDFLAFKNDIMFWRNTKTLEGLSIRTVLMNVVIQVVILLYLFDNDTSWMILMSNVVGVAIEVWKLRKAMVVNLEWRGIIPIIKLSDKEAYAKTKTREYDDIAMAHLSFALYPLVLGYAIYSLLYAKHKGFYSWILSTLVGAVYTFGFITMTPQLFINYKLKSVAHMPWRAMVYKSLNTFIDDLFSFVVKMPLMHRLACFRDDIIFFIYLYQRYKYPVDAKRKNEFGASQEDYERSERAKREGIEAVLRKPIRAKTDK
jgi:hypothetical protein